MHFQVTIFPAETVKNSQTLPAKWITEKNPNRANSAGPKYNTWFYDLQGGRTEYVITIACMIGKSRMKGTVTTTKLPLL